VSYLLAAATASYFLTSATHCTTATSPSCSWGDCGDCRNHIMGLLAVLDGKQVRPGAQRLFVCHIRFGEKDVELPGQHVQNKQSKNRDSLSTMFRNRKEPSTLANEALWLMVQKSGSLTTLF
jgi:hypothetical protein